MNMKNFLMGSVAFAIVFSCLGAGYYFLYIKPHQEAELIKIEREKMEEQKRIAQQEEDRRLEEERKKIEEENAYKRKVTEDTEKFNECASHADDNMMAWIDAKIGCDYNYPGKEGTCIFKISGNEAILDQLKSEHDIAVDNCYKIYPNAILEGTPYAAIVANTSR